jgi:hypothetical protein
MLHRELYWEEKNVVSENKNDRYFGERENEDDNNAVTDGVASFPLTKHVFLKKFFSLRPASQVTEEKFAVI